MPFLNSKSKDVLNTHVLQPAELFTQIHEKHTI